MDKPVDIQEAQRNLPELVSRARAGDDIVISENDMPVARIIPISSARRTAGLNEGAMLATDDFDDPMPDEFWTEPA